jgi:hypothetical protein
MNTINLGGISVLKLPTIDASHVGVQEAPAPWKAA